MLEKLKNMGVGAATFLAVVAVLVGAVTANLQAQSTPAPGQFAQAYVLASAVAASGPASSVRNVATNKTYQVTSSTVSGTGTAIVTIEGSNDSVAWNTVGTVTLTLSATPATGFLNSTDRFVLIRPDATTLTGNTATYTATMGY